MDFIILNWDKFTIILFNFFQGNNKLTFLLGMMVAFITTSITHTVFEKKKKKKKKSKQSCMN